MFAIVGGGCLVWGVGATELDAWTDAKRWLAESDREEGEETPLLECHEISTEQGASIERGNVSWPVKDQAAYIYVCDACGKASRTKCKLHGIL